MKTIHLTVIPLLFFLFIFAPARIFFAQQGDQPMTEDEIFSKILVVKNPFMLHWQKERSDAVISAFDTGNFPVEEEEEYMPAANKTFVKKEDFEKVELDYDSILPRLIQKNYVAPDHQVQASFIVLDDEFKSWFPEYSEEKFNQVEEVLRGAQNTSADKGGVVTPQQFKRAKLDYAAVLPKLIQKGYVSKDRYVNPEFNTLSKDFKEAFPAYTPEQFDQLEHILHDSQNTQKIESGEVVPRQFRKAKLDHDALMPKLVQKGYVTADHRVNTNFTQLDTDFKNAFPGLGQEKFDQIEQILHESKNAQKENAGSVSRWQFQKSKLDYSAIMPKLIEKKYVTPDHKVNPQFKSVDSQFKSWFPDYSSETFGNIESMLHDSRKVQQQYAVEQPSIQRPMGSAPLNQQRFQQANLDFGALVPKLIEKGYVTPDLKVNSGFNQLDNEFKSWFPGFTQDKFDKVQAILQDSQYSQANNAPVQNNSNMYAQAGQQRGSSKYPAANVYPPQHVVQGVVWNSDRPVAIIDNKIVKVGERIAESQLISVKRSTVEVLFHGQKFTLHVQQ